MVTFEDFSKIELKIGTVLEAENVAGSEKLVKLMVDLGPSQSSGQNLAHDVRQILAGIKQWYKTKDLVGKQVVVAANLESRMMMGLESQGMILCAGSDRPVFLKPSQKVPPGTKVR